MLRFLLILFIFLSTVANAQSYCARASGYLSTEYGYKETSHLRSLCNDLSNGKDFLLISRIDWDLANDLTATNVREEAMQKFFERGGAEEPVIKSAVDKLISTSPDLANVPKRLVTWQVVKRYLFDHKDYGSDTEYFYIYHSNKKLLSALSDGIAYEKGVTIESAPENVGRLLSIEGNPQHPFLQMIRDGDIGAVVLQGINRSSDISSYLPEKTPVFHLNFPSQQSKTQLASKAETVLSLVNDPGANTITRVFNLFPREKAEATAWGFDPLLSEQYSAAGKRFVRQIENNGHANALSHFSTRVEFLDALKEASSRNYKVLVLAEANSKGELRLPGSRDVITQKDLANIGDLSSVFFLSCNSAKVAISSASLKFEGKVYTENASVFLEHLLPQASGTVEKHERVVVRLGKTDLVGVTVASANDVACDLEEGQDCSVEIRSFQF